MKDQKKPQDKAYLNEIETKEAFKNWCNSNKTQDEKEEEDGQTAIIALMIFVLIMLFIIMPTLSSVKNSQTTTNLTYWQLITGSQ